MPDKARTTPSLSLPLCSIQETSPLHVGTQERSSRPLALAVWWTMAWVPKACRQCHKDPPWLHVSVAKRKKVHVSDIRECGGNDSLQSSDGTYFYFGDLGVSHIGKPIQHAYNSTWWTEMEFTRKTIPHTNAYAQNDLEARLWLHTLSNQFIDRSPYIRYTNHK